MTGPELLRRWLQDKKQTPDTLAESAGSHRSAIYSYLSRRRSPNLAAALTLQRITGIPVESWAVNVDPSAPGEPSSRTAA